MSPGDLAQLGFGHSPFMRFLGLELVKAEKGRVEIRLPFREEFIRADGSDWLHGGVVSALADIVGDYAVITRGLTAGEEVVASDVTPAVPGMLLNATPDEALAARIRSFAAGERGK